MSNSPEMRCPKCGGTIEFDYLCGKFSQDNEYINCCRGHCVNCETDYQWKEVYKFMRQEDLTEVSSN